MNTNNKFDLRTGNILLAEPFMLDGNFRQSVVLLCDHTEEDGTLGFILNKRLDMLLNDLVFSFPKINVPVYFGGPVATDTIHYIHNIGPTLEGSVEVSDGVWWGGDFEQLKNLVVDKVVKPENIRFFVGYSGWEIGQLEMEMEMRSWVISAMKYDYLFRSNDYTLWQECMIDKGERFAILSEIPSGKAICN